MTRKIHVTEAAEDIGAAVIIGSVHMETNEHGKRTVIWELEDHFNFNDTQMQAMENTTVMLNDLAKGRGVAPEEDTGTFIGVFSDGGLVRSIETYTSLEKGKEHMLAYCYEYGFDPEVDDARIFQVHEDKENEEVYSVDIDKYVSPAHRRKALLAFSQEVEKGADKE